VQGNRAIDRVDVVVFAILLSVFFVLSILAQANSVDQALVSSRWSPTDVLLMPECS
jgi:hypothetical protein